MDLFIFKCFYLILPAYFANMAPVIFRNILPKLAKPVDLGFKLKGKPLFGKNKTFRGLLAGTVVGVIIAYIQRLLYVNGIIQVSFTDLSNWLILGFLMGFGAMLGDMVESFFKRQFNILPGQRFIPWDQLDFVIGAMLLTSFIFKYTPQIILVVLLLTFMLHISVNHLAFYLKIRNEKW